MDHTNISAGRIAELSGEPIAIVPYSEEWPARYAAEEARLSAELPPDLCTRSAHIAMVHRAASRWTPCVPCAHGGAR